MLTHFMLIQKSCLFLENQIYIQIQLPDSIYIRSWFFFFIVEFQWFLIELSVRPGNIFVISAHLLPCAVWAKKRIHSSWGFHSSFLMLGLRWLCQRYRHCLPNLPSTNLAMKDHRWGPYFSTNFRTRLSSCSVQGFFFKNLSRLFSDYSPESLLSYSGISSSYTFLPMITVSI